MKQYKPVNLLNEVVKKYDIESDFGSLQVGVVECADGFRVYIFADGEEQGSLSIDDMKDADSKVNEICESCHGHIS